MSNRCKPKEADIGSMTRKITLKHDADGRHGQVTFLWPAEGSYTSCRSAKGNRHEPPNVPSCLLWFSLVQVTASWTGSKTMQAELCQEENAFADPDIQQENVTCSLLRRRRAGLHISTGPTAFNML